MSLLETFCSVDDFCQEFDPIWKQRLLKYGLRRRKRKSRRSLSEVMTLIIHFHQSGCRNLKTYYVNYVQQYLQTKFPGLVSYSCFVCSMIWNDKLLLRKRPIIEMMNDQFKNIS